jgi:3-methylfumaryl-CoA hydratase
MAGGTKVRIFRPIRPGDILVATRSLADMFEKSGSQGPLIFLVYRLEVRTEAGEPVAEETQTRIVR